MTVSSELLHERELDSVIVQDGDGVIIHNSMQQDDPVILRDYADGTRHLLSKRTGRLLVAPFNPQTVKRHRCPHCNGELGGAAP